MSAPISSKREELLENAKACGRFGASRVSDDILFADGRDPTDTFIGAAWDAFEQGQKERTKHA